MRKSIYIGIPVYGLGNIDYTIKQLNEFLTIGLYSLDIEYFYTDDRFPQIIKEKFDETKLTNIKFLKRDESLGLMLPFEVRLAIKEKINQYDYYLYTEDDLAITQKNIRAYIDVNNQLKGSNYVTGFVRYETEKHVKTFPDLSGIHSVNSGGDGFSIIKNVDNVNGCKYFSPWNPHSSCFIFDNEQLNNLGDSITDLSNRYYKEIETIGTNLYLTDKYTKVYPVDRFEDIMIHHLPNKYLYWRTSPTLHTLFNLLGER